MQKCDKDFLELYLTSTTLIGSNNKIICDSEDHILYTSKNISDNYSVGEKLEFTRLPHSIDKKLEYSPLTGAILMIIYDLGKQHIITNSEQSAKTAFNLFTLDECKQKLSTISDCDNADLDFLALYVTFKQYVSDGYTKARINIYGKNNSLIYGDKSEQDFETTKKIISPLSGKLLGKIAY